MTLSLLAINKASFLSCTITLSLVIVRSGGGRNVGSVPLELRQAPGSGLWDWEKGPGGGLGSDPRLALTTSEDIGGCVYPVMRSLRAEVCFLIHSLVHTFTRYGMPLGARQCTRCIL